MKILSRFLVIMVSIFTLSAAADVFELENDSSTKTVEIAKPGEDLGLTNGSLELSGTGYSASYVSGIAAAIMVNDSLMAQFTQQCGLAQNSASRACLQIEIKNEISRQLQKVAQ